MEFFYGDDKKFYKAFKNIDELIAKDVVKDKEFICTPQYSSKNDLLKSLFSMQSFEAELLEKGHKTFVEKLLIDIKNIIPENKHSSFYRIIKNEKNEYFLRAIVSERYNDYNDNITVLLGLIGISRQMELKQAEFVIQKFEYNEPYVRIYFGKEKAKLISGVGKVKYVIEVSNDEIKRESLKFVGAVNIIYGEENGEEKQLYIKSNRVKHKLLSISHGSTPETAIAKLKDLDQYIEQEDDVYKTIEDISKTKNLNGIKHLVYRKIEKSKNPGIVSKRKILLNELNNEVDTMFKLFAALGKVEELVEDIDGKEFLSYLYYDALIYKKINKDDYEVDE